MTRVTIARMQQSDRIKGRIHRKNPLFCILLTEFGRWHRRRFPSRSTLEMSCTARPRSVRPVADPSGFALSATVRSSRYIAVRIVRPVRQPGRIGIVTARSRVLFASSRWRKPCVFLVGLGFSQSLPYLIKALPCDAPVTTAGKPGRSSSAAMVVQAATPSAASFSISL
jgi:hypothetical protein